MPDGIESKPSTIESTLDPPEATRLAASAPDSGTVPLAGLPRAGDLSLGWRAVTATTWICVVLALAAVWNASVQLGLSTWWLGPRSEPQSKLVQVSPFIAPVLMVLGAVNQVRWLPVFGLAAAGLLAAMGVGDLDRVATLATVEIAIAIAAGLVSLASVTGIYRRTGAVPAEVDAAATR